MDEQLIIDILYFIFHDVFQWLSYFTILTLMLTPRFNRAFIILVPFAVAFSPPVYPLLDDKYFSQYFLVAMMVITVLVCFKEKKRICIAALALSQLSLTLIALVSTSVVYNVLGYYPTEVRPYTKDAIIYTVVLDIILWINFLILLRIWNKLLKRKNTNSLGYFWLFPFGQGLFFTACLFRAWEEMDKYLLTNPYLIVAVVVALLSDFLMYHALKENSHVQEMKQTIALLENEMQLQLKYYDDLAEQYTQIREYRHDILNLLAAARTLTYTGDDISIQERDSLLSEMETKAEKMSVPIYCGDALVNAVLWQKSNEAKKKNIGFTVNMDKSEKLNLERIDTCSLLVNLIDNAMEEAAKHEDNSFVTVTIRRKAGLLFIKTTNNTDMTIDTEDKPKTKKTGDHGHGTDIINRIVEKYNGAYVLNADGNTARSVVSLTEIG